MALSIASLQFVLTPSDRYYAVRNRRRPVRAPDEATSSRYMASLEQLAITLPMERLPWYLEGGMALAAHVGAFFRFHSDVDIGVFVDDVCEMEACLAEQNYRLFSRNPLLKSLEYRRFDLVRPTCGAEVQSDRRVKRLTAMKVDDRGKVVDQNCVLPRFDIHVHRRSGNQVLLTEKRIAFPSDLFNQNKVFETSNRSRIRLASVPLVYFFKLQGCRPKEQFDRDLIERLGLIKATDAQRVRNLVYADSRGAAGSGTGSVTPAFVAA